jgi:tetratricopeptide (TPR) repeat protein
LEKLKATGKEKEVRGRHLTYFGRLVVELSPKLLDQDLIVTLKTIDRELGNLRLAIDYGLRLGQFEAVTQLTNTFYWVMRGYISEERNNLEQVLALPGATGINRGWALFQAGFAALWQAGALKAAFDYFDEARTLSRDHADEVLLVAALTGLGFVYSCQKNFAGAMNYYKEALAVVEEMERVERFFKSWVKLTMGMVFTAQGYYKEGRQLYEEAMSIARELGNAWSIVQILYAQARLAMVLEDFAAVHRYLEEALPLSEEVGPLRGKSGVLVYQAQVWSYEGKFREARQALEQNLDMGFIGTLRSDFNNTLLGVALLISKNRLKNRLKDQPEQITCLCSAALAFGPGVVEGLDLPFRTYYEQALGIAQSDLDEKAFEMAFARGRAMTLEEAIVYARQALLGI